MAQRRIDTARNGQPVTGYAYTTHGRWLVRRWGDGALSYMDSGVLYSTAQPDRRIDGTAVQIDATLRNQWCRPTLRG